VSEIPCLRGVFTRGELTKQPSGLFFKRGRFARKSVPLLWSYSNLPADLIGTITKIKVFLQSDGYNKIIFVFLFTAFSVYFFHLPHKINYKGFSALNRKLRFNESERQGKMKKYMPEGFLINTAENQRLISSPSGLHEAMVSGKILECRAKLCDSQHNIIVDLPCMKGIIPKIEGAIGIENGKTREIALISRVNKPVCFKVVSINTNDDGTETAILSRRAVQEECRKNYIEKLSSGDIIPAKVTHLEQFGCFVDVGCGIPSLIPIDAISVSRISHPADRFVNGQDIKVIIKDIDKDRIWLSHKELLGTWEENAALFKAGETVSGIVRSVENYGIFIELTPNLAGLAEIGRNAQIGDYTSVYIKAIIPEKMKIKLIIVDIFSAEYKPVPLKYFIEETHISSWKYPPENSLKKIESVF